MLTNLRSLASTALVGATLALTSFAQTVVTDKPTYDHGETAIITAVGFQANEQVTFTITCPTCITPTLEQPWLAQADTEGEIVTTWTVSPAAPFGSEFEVSASGSNGAQANFLFSNALGSGRVASVTPVTGGCVQQALPPVTGTELWYVEEYESYRVRLTNVTDVGAGGTAASIQVIVNSQNTASQCVTATRISTGVYEFITDMPPNACEGYGILYGTTGCASTPAARVARRSDGIAQQSRLRVAYFGAGCTAPVQDNVCTCPAITLSCPNNITACADAQGCTQVVYFNPQVSGGCPDLQVTSNPPSGSVFPIGTTTVTVTATDFFGTQQCTFTVTVNDCNAPTITCPSNITQCADNGACSAVVNFSVTGVDGCSTPVTVVANPPSGSNFPIGTTTVNATATDAAGNVSNCSFTVTVNDCENPTVQCPADITQCSDQGQCGAVVTFSVPGADNCAGATVVATPASGSLFPVGTTVVTATATDAAGNTSNCSFNVTVNDCEAPTTSVPSPITVCNDAGACGAIVSFTATGSDNCPGVSVSSVPTSGSSFPIGTTTVTTTATDAAGNTSSGTFTVTVNDCEDPVVTCPTSITQCNDTGACGAVVTFQTSVTDNCPGSTVVATPASGSTFPVGTTTVNVVGTDAAGRTANCSFTVTVNDCENPVASCPSDITTCNDTGACGAVVTFNASGSDNCPGSTTVATPASGSTFPIGTTVVNVVTTDAAGNTDQCSFNVTVNDCESPTISVPNPITVCNDAGSCGATVSFSVTGSDNCPGYTVSASPASGSVFPVGTTTVNASVTDAAGNVTNGSFTVTVNDCEDPVATCPTAISQCADAGSCGAVVTFNVGSTDNCSGSSAVATPASGSTFPLGTTTVNVVATDAAGRTSTCSFTVTITDCEAPTVQCPANVTTCADAGSCGAVVNFNASGADNCGAPTVFASPASGSTFPIGTTTVVVTATDAAGNSQQCSFTVTVNDCENPTVQCPANVTVCNAPGQCSAVVNFVATGTDNCAGLSVLASPASGSAFPVGTSTVTVTATDAAGNTSSCTFTVTVNDCEPPTIVCPPNFVETWMGQGPASGQTNPSRTGFATFSDNCSATLTYTDTFQPGMAPGEPETIVTRRWCATDTAGRQACCTQTITLLSPGNHGGVFLDMSPGNCPNTVQIWTSGYARGSVLGSFQFDVSQIIPTSLRIVRADGVGRPLNPSLEIYQDNSTPFRGVQGGCNAVGADGSVDLTFRVLKDKMRRAFLLGNLPEGTQVPIMITGRLYNGAVFQTRDFIRVSHQQ